METIKEGSFVHLIENIKYKYEKNNYDVALHNVSITSSKITCDASLSMYDLFNGILSNLVNCFHSD